MYGSPLTSGYGEIGHYYAWAFASGESSPLSSLDSSTRRRRSCCWRCLFFVAPACSHARGSRVSGCWSADHRRRVPVLPVLHAVRRLVVPAIPAADVAGDDAAERGGAGHDRAAMDRAVVSGCRVGDRGGGRLARCAFGHRSQRLRSRVGRSAIHERGAIRGRAHRTRRRHPLDAAQRLGPPLCRPADAPFRLTGPGSARPRDRVPPVDAPAAVHRARWRRSADLSWRVSAGAAGFGALDWTPLATLAAPPIFVFDLLESSRTDAPLAISTLSSRAGWRCTEPPIWPPLLRLK